jgi:hypothetical protein
VLALAPQVRHKYVVSGRVQISAIDLTDSRSACLRARLRRDRVETARLALPVRTLTALGEGQKSESAGSEARGRGGLGPLKRVRLASKAEANPRYSVNPLPLQRALIAFHLVPPLEQTPSLPQRSPSALVPKAKRSESRGNRKYAWYVPIPAEVKRGNSDPIVNISSRPPLPVALVR